MDLISVIVPIYKVEKYLDRCVESIVNQTYQNLEIILVDDGSPDSCGEICDRWSEKDARIKVIHKPNGGLSDARNVGVVHSTGDYITFVDSDDYISVDMISYLYELIIRYNADVSCCNRRLTSLSNEAFENQPTESIVTFNNVESVKALFGTLYIQLVTAWGKLYKTEMVKNIPFPVGRLHEDEAVTYKYYYESNRVAISNLELYAYFQNEGSITHNKTEKNIIDTLLAFEEQVLYFHNKQNYTLRDLAYSKYVQHLINFASDRNKYSKRKLKAVPFLEYMRCETRMANKLNYICWLIFKRNLYKTYCQWRNRRK